MPLLGTAAMLLVFDVEPAAVPEHDDWHTHEHLPERLSIPGFIRGTRWVARQGRPRYFVLYEVAELATLTSDAYLQRLNSPTAWTSKMMPHYRDMTRGLCSVTGSFGFGTGHSALLIRLKPRIEHRAALRRWLLEEALPSLPSQRGLGSIHLLERAVAAPMTNEQQIRGADAGVDWAIVATAYDEDALTNIWRDRIDWHHLEQYASSGIAEGMYRIDYSLSHHELSP